MDAFGPRLCDVDGVSCLVHSDNSVGILEDARRFLAEVGALSVDGTGKLEMYSSGSGWGSMSFRMHFERWCGRG